MTHDWQRVQGLWRKELMAVLLLALLTTPIFWFTDLDIVAGDVYYHPENPDQPWYEEDKPLWAFFYKASPLLAAVMAFGAIFIMMLGSITQRFRPYKRRALFVVLLVIMGPGLVVNTIFKDNWERPRPRQIVELGGELPYLPPLMKGDFDQPAKSFPAGHPSVSFALAAALWLLFRRRYKYWAAAGFVAASITGVLFGIGRMAAGGHFLSDILWSAYFPWLVAIALYYGVLKIPYHEAHPSAAWNEPIKRPWLAASPYVLLFVVVGFGVSLASPQKYDWSYTWDQQEQTPTIRFEADAARIKIEILDAGISESKLRGQIRGFGLPTNSVSYNQSIIADTRVFTLATQGVFTEKNATFHLLIPQGSVQKIDIDMPTGKVEVACVSAGCDKPEWHWQQQDIKE